MNITKLNGRLRLATFIGIVASATAAHATWYTSEASFDAAIDSSYYLEDFNSFLSGLPLAGQSSWTEAGANGYGWTATAPGGLWSNPGALSTYNPLPDALTLTFSGLPVTAFGGLLANNDGSYNLIAGNETITLSDGESQTITTTAGNEGFLGWVGTAPITSATIAGSDNGDYIQLDHVYTGAALPAPEPVSIISLGLGAAALLRRRVRR